VKEVTAFNGPSIMRGFIHRREAELAQSEEQEPEECDARKDK
jgi:hypothetical protein